MPSAICCQGPAGSTAASRSKEKDRQIAGIQRPVVAVLEAGGTGHEHGTEAGKIDDFVVGDQRQHGAAEIGIAGGFPEAAGLKKRVRHPDIGVGGGVGIENLPLAVLVLAPEPGREVGFEIAAGEIGLGPGEDAVEGGAIVVGQSKEQGVGLAFGGGVLISVGIEDAAALRDR